VASVVVSSTGAAAAPHRPQGLHGFFAAQGFAAICAAGFATAFVATCPDRTPAASNAAGMTAVDNSDVLKGFIRSSLP